MMGRISPRLPQQREPGGAERHGGNPRSHHQAPTSVSTTKPYLSMTYDPPCRLVIPLPTAVATVPNGGIAFSPSSQPPPPPIQGPAAVQKPSGSSSSGPKVAFAVNPPFPPQTTTTASRKGMAGPAVTAAGATLLPHGAIAAPPPPPSEYSIAPTGVVLEHQYQKAPTVDTRIAWFATNLPREVSARSSRKAQLERTAANKAAAAATTTTPPPAALQAGVNNQLPLSGALHHKLTSRDVQEGKFRGLGWVEPPVFGAPCPPSASSRKLQEGALISDGSLESNSQMSATLRLMGSRSNHTALPFDNSGRSDGAPPDRRTTAQPASSAHASAAANALLKNQLLGGGTDDDAFAESKQQTGGWLAATKGLGKHVAGGGRLRAGTVPTEVMIVIFRFCSPTLLDRSVVLVSRLWHYIVVSSTLLQRQRFTFEMPPFHGLVSKHEEGKAGAPVSAGRGAVVPSAAALLTPGSSSLNSGHEPLLTGGKRQPGGASSSSSSATATSFPVRGILYYLATRKQHSAALRASSATSNDARTGNPAYGLDPVVRNFCVSTLAEAGPYLRGSVPPPSPPSSLQSSVFASNMNHRQKAWKAKGAAAGAGVSSSSSSSAASDPRDFTSYGPSSFTTAAVPFAWAGFELQQGMKVIPTAYCFCSSLLIQGSNVGALPNSWELQCCAVPSTRIAEGGAVSATEWATAQWHLLHVVPSLHEAVADGRIAVVSLPSGARQVFCTLPELRSTATKALMGQLRPHDAKDYGAMCRFRMVQTGRNEQWGESMAVSGFELFGWLQKTHQR